jgi:hypothetical protein
LTHFNPCSLRAFLLISLVLRLGGIFCRVYSRCGLNIARPIATDPAIYLTLVAHLTAEKLVKWDIQIAS